MLHEVSFPSYNERDNVQGWIYVPACKPRGIIQIVHGFGEHSRRYLHMIVAFLDDGFIVVADDHVGHGKTAMENDTWGDWGDAGYHTMMEDERSFEKLVSEKYPDLPYILYGNSLGSMIVRDFVAKYGDEIDGLVLSGTCGVFRNADIVASKLEKAIAEGKGGESDMVYVDELMGWLGERCEEDVKVGNEWVCHDPYVQRDYVDDPLDAFTKSTTNRSVYYFAEMMRAVDGQQWAERVPVGLPIYNIAGDHDPVGDYGEGVYMVSNWLVKTGHDVITTVYSGYRHAINSYADLECEVEEGILDFINARCLGD